MQKSGLDNILIAEAKKNLVYFIGSLNIRNLYIGKVGEYLYVSKSRVSLI